MARIERPGSRQVLPGVADQPQLSIPTGGLGNLARSLTTGLKDAADLYADIKVTEAKTQAEEARNKFEGYVDNTLYDPTTGYFTTSGKNSYTSIEKVTGGLEEARKNLAGNLSPLAQSFYEDQTEGLFDSSVRNANVHAAQGLEAWREQEFGLFQTQTLRRAVNLGGSPEDLAQLITTSRDEIIDWGLAHDWSKEEIAANLGNFTSSILTNAINGAVARGDLAYANELYENNEENFLATDYIRVTAELTQAAEREETKNEANRALGLAHELLASQGGLGGALAAASQFGDPEFVERTRENIEEIHRRQLLVRDFNQAQSYLTVTTYIEKTPEATTADIIGAFPNQWSSMTPDQRGAVTGSVEFDARLENYFALLSAPQNLAADLTYSEVTQSVPAEYVDKALNYLKKVKSGKGVEQGAPEDIGGVSPELASMVKVRINKLYGKPDDRNEEEQRKAEQAYYIVDKMAGDLADKGRLTPEDSQKILDAISLSVKGEDDPVQVPIGTIGSRIINPVLGFFTGGEESTGLKDIPAEEQRAASQGLRELGLPITVENVITYSQAGASSPQIKAQLDAMLVLHDAQVPVTPEAMSFYVDDGLGASQYDAIAEFLKAQGTKVTKANVYEAYFEAQNGR